MIINIIGKFDKESFGSHIRDTLIKMGHTVICIEFGIKYLRSNRVLYYFNQVYSKMSQFMENIPVYQHMQTRSLIDGINKNADFTLLTHDFIVPKVVDTIREITKSPVVLWFPDAIVNFRKAMFLDSNYDFLFFKDPYIVQTLKNDFKKNIYYLPECCNPDIHKIIDTNINDFEKYTCDITTAGNLYTNRSAFFKQLMPLGYNIKVWGNPPALWMKTSGIKKIIMNEFLTGNEKGKAFGLAKIVLNNLHPGEIAGINCRAFEIPAYGGFQIINWRPAINELFEIDKEIVVFKNFDELIEKINFFLTHEEQRKEIIKMAHLKVHAAHTYEKRLAVLMDTLFSRAKGFHSNFKI